MLRVDVLSSNAGLPNTFFGFFPFVLLCFILDLFIHLMGVGGEHKQGELQAARKGEADSSPSRQPDVRLECRTLRS